MLVVPASMALLGRANWWLPGWLDRFIPQLTVEGAGQHHGAPALDEIEELVPAGSGGSAGRRSVAAPANAGGRRS
jgi:RND superfamily putative drug exporter